MGAVFVLGAVALWLGLTCELFEVRETLRYRVPIVGTVLVLHENVACYSVLSGTGALYDSGNYALFFAVAIFSVLLPIAKLIVAGVVHWSRVLPRRVAGRALKVLMVLGKWGMLDAIVMVAFVVAGGLRGLVAIREGVGLYWFVAAVLLGKAIIWMVENTFLERSAPAEARREGAHASSRLACVLASGAPVFVVAAGVCLAMGLSTDLVDVSKHLVWRFGMLGVSVDVYHYAARLSVLDGLGYLWRGDNYGMFVLSLLFVVLLPIGKVVLSGAGLVADATGGAWRLGPLADRALGVVARLSMLDILAAACFLVGPRLETLVHLKPLPGLYWLCAAVILSKLALVAVRRRKVALPRPGTK